MSIPPASARPSAIHLRAAAAELKSTGPKADIRPPAARTSDAVCAAPDWLTSHPTTIAPSVANSLAAARPWPLATPVMKAIFPESLPIIPPQCLGSACSLCNKTYNLAIRRGARASGFRNDSVFDMADAFDFYFHHVANLQVHRWLPRAAHARGRSRRKNVARLQGEYGRQLLDHFAEAINELTGVAILAQLAIHPGANRQLMHVGELIRRHDPGANGSVRIE